MKVKALLAIATAMSLAACAAPEAHRHDHGQHHEHNHAHEHGHQHHDMHNHDRVQSFSCENGLSVQVRNLSTNQVELRLDDKVATLSSAVAGSGERYVANQGLFGKGAEWHKKGSEAFFGFTDPYGNKVETSCSAR